MESRIVYKEQQRFRQWWLWAIILALTIFWLSLILISRELIVVLLALILDLGLIVFMYSLKLDTEVTYTGIRIKFWPFHRRWLLFEFSNLKSAEEATYRPLADYGGWGIRYGIFNELHAKAYTVSGNKGVMVRMADETYILIGSKNPEELMSSIECGTLYRSGTGVNDPHE